MKTPRIITGGFTLALLLGIPVAAQTDGPSPAFYEEELVEQDGAVDGRIRHIEGTLTLRRDNAITGDLVINDPVAPGDVLTTGADGRCEVQLADGSLLRIDTDTELVFQSLSDSTNQIENTTILQLGSGALIVQASEMDTNEKRFQIDTDSASVFLLSNGLFRLEARRGGTTAVSSRRGVAEVMAQDISTMVRSGERTTVRPGQIPAEPQVFNTRMSDDFDAWAAERDDAMVRRARIDDQEPAGLPEPVRPYVSELSYYGHWYHNPSYGWVWRPVGLAGDWQPYIDGYWAYAPSGIFWVSYEPWGWAPYHYGRWEFLVGTGWIWIPGHMFSGAYVAWSVSPGYFGWCPLGYYDRPAHYHVRSGHHHGPWVYVRGHHLYEHHVRRVTIRDVTVIREIEERRVVVRGAPRVDPRRVRNAPQVTEEFHRTFSGRPEFQIPRETDVRRMPFHENERQRLVRINNRRATEKGSEVKPVTRGGSRRQLPTMAPGGGRDVTVPRRTRTGPQSVPPGARRQGDGRQNGKVDRERDRPPQSPAARPGARDNNSRPERVIPRILPRSGGNAQPKASAPKAVTRRDPSRGQPTKPPAREARPAPQKSPGKQPAGRQEPSKKGDSGSKPKGGDGKGNKKD